MQNEHSFYDSSLKKFVPRVSLSKNATSAPATGVHQKQSNAAMPHLQNNFIMMQSQSISGLNSPLRGNPVGFLPPTDDPAWKWPPSDGFPFDWPLHDEPDSSRSKQDPAGAPPGTDTPPADIARTDCDTTVSFHGTMDRWLPVLSSLVSTEMSDEEFESTYHRKRRHHQPFTEKSVEDALKHGLSEGEAETDDRLAQKEKQDFPPNWLWFELEKHAKIEAAAACDKHTPACKAAPKCVPIRTAHLHVVWDLTKIEKGSAPEDVVLPKGFPIEPGDPIIGWAKYFYSARFECGCRPDGPGVPK